MKIIRKFTLSCGTFGGFSIDIDVNTLESIDDIIRFIISALKEKLIELKLDQLVCILERISVNYHIHDYNFGDILLINKPYFVCNHNCNEENIKNELYWHQR